MNNYMSFYGEGIKGTFQAPFDEKMEGYNVSVYGKDLSGMKLRGMCKRLSFVDVYDFNKVDLSGFIDLEIGEIIVLWSHPTGLLKLLELNCKNIWSPDKKLKQILNNYVQEEPDPLMRDFEGCKLELAINGYGNRL